MKNHIKPRKRGISIPISTIIIVGAFIPVIVATAIFSTNMFEAQLQNSEFAYAENFMVTLAQVIEDVASQPNSTSYLKLNLRRGRLNVGSGRFPIDISFGNVRYQSQSIYLEYVGGSLCGTLDRVLRGVNETIISVDETAPLGVVYKKQYNGARILLNFARLRIIKLADYYYLEDLDNYTTIYEIHYIDLQYGGSTPGIGPIYIKVKNMGRFIGSVTDTSNITITAQIGSVIYGITFPKAQNVKYVTVRLVVTKVGIFFIGG